MGGWSDKTKLILISTLVEVVVEVEVELGNFKKSDRGGRSAPSSGLGYLFWCAYLMSSSASDSKIFVEALPLHKIY